MKKSIVDKNVYYRLIWSQVFIYDRLTTARVLPELSGILCFFEKKGGNFKNLLFFGCWRSGLRFGMKTLPDPAFSRIPDISNNLFNRDLYFKYAVVDSNSSDMHDIMYKLIKMYKPEFNNIDNFHHSARYINIYISETEMKGSEYIEKFPMYSP